MNENSKYITTDEIETLEKALNSYLTKKLYEYLYKVSKELKSDIDGFGKHVVQDFQTFEDWENFNWLDNFKNSFFHIFVDTTVKSSYIIMES